MGRSATEAINDVIEVLLREKKKILLRHWGKGERCLKLVRPVKTLLVERFNCRLREVPSSFKVERFWRLNWAVIGPGL